MVGQEMAEEILGLGNLTHDDLMKVLATEPQLSSWGVGNSRLYERNRITPGKVVGWREELKSELGMFQTCCAYLFLCRKRKTINPRVGSSYSLKHLVEAWSGEYVTNGAFIAALIHIGIKYEVHEGSLNVTVAISSHLPRGPKQVAST